MLFRVSATSLVIAAAAVVPSGCSAGADMIASSTTAATHGQAGALPPGPAAPDSVSNALVVTGQQRAYLDELKSAGVRPSSDLLALSIGSYVCQARAAKQSEQAVWDFVLPMVRSDVRGQRSDAVAVPQAGELNSVTADYIRIATQRLC